MRAHAYEDVRSKVASFRHKSADPHDQGYAETVYRTVIGPDGQPRDNYTVMMKQLRIDLNDILEK